MAFLYSAHKSTGPFEAIKTMGPEHDGHHCADYTFRGIFYNENDSIEIRVLMKSFFLFLLISTKSASKGLIDRMALHWTGKNPLI